jgi:SagB-type dehydrogenase family enzyme
MAPDLQTVRSFPLLDITERRRSIRRHDDGHPITADQLGELLYRTQRLKSLHTVEGFGDVASRPYPSGGSLYELEVYALVNLCAGVDPGLYHYRSEAHSLELVAEPNAATERLGDLYRMTAGMASPPQVVLILSARFPRVMWKYEGVGYGVILKNVGIVQEALYLHATDLGLAPCALGGGDSDLFCALTGTGYFSESSVGEFLVGSCPPDFQPPPWRVWYPDDSVQEATHHGVH